ncbi:MAG: hypothetical protein U0457_15935 [Candidatus Sericytochromatia bacterium]
MRQFKTLSIRKAVQSSLGRTKAEKYFKDEELKLHESDLMEVYNLALKKLSEGKIVNAINCILYGLDIEKENKFFFSLSKSIVVLLEKELESNKAIKLKQKYTENFETVRGTIKSKIEYIEKNIDSVSNSLEKIEKDLYESKPKFFSLDKLFVTYKMKQSKLAPRIKELKKELQEYELEIEDLKGELKDIDKFAFMEECQKVVALIMEICLFPSRFNTRN